MRSSDIFIAIDMTHIRSSLSMHHRPKRGDVWDDDDTEEDSDEDADPYALLGSLEAESIGFDIEKAYQLKMALQSGVRGMDGVEDDDGGGGGSDDEWIGRGNDEEEFSFDNPVVGRQKGVDVVKELKDLCLEHGGGSFQNLSIELNSFKFSQNATYEDVLCGAILNCAERASKSSDVSTLSKALAALKKEMVAWSELFKKCAPRPTDEVGIICGLERILKTPDYAPFAAQGGLRFLLQTMFDAEVVCEEAILSWKGRREGGEGDENAIKLFGDERIKEFLEWIEEEEEESSEEESEEEE